MTQQTQQFAYRWLVVTVCISFGALCVAVIASIFYFGDGEGIRIISDLQNYVIAGYISLLGGLFGHQFLASKISPLLPSGALIGQGGISTPTDTPAEPDASSTQDSPPMGA